MPIGDPTQLQQIGQALQGFSAGISGDLPRFQNQMLQQQAFQQQTQLDEAEMMEAREQAMFDDANAASIMAEAGDWDALSQFGMDRLLKLQQLGAQDPSDTQRMTRLALAARNGSEEAKQLLKDELETVVSIGRATGRLDRPARAQGATDLGKAREDLNSGLIDEAQYQALADGILSEEETPADQRARKIQQYISNFGLSENEAIQAVDSVFTTDQNGNSILFDPITQEATLLNPSYSDQSSSGLTIPEETSTEDLAIDAAAGTGMWASLLSAYNSTVGQLPFMPIAEGPEQAAADLRVLERDAIRALASSNRPPVIEQQRIMAVIPEALSFFENPEVAELQTANFIDLMMQQYADDLRFSQDPANPQNVRNSSRERANNIESIVRRVLKPDAAAAIFNAANSMEGVGSRIMEMSLEDLESLELSDLSDEELDQYAQRLRQGN